MLQLLETLPSSVADASGLTIFLYAVAAAAAAFGLVAGLTPLVIRVARARGWVANPSADRWHSTPTALMGGIALFLGFAVTVLFMVPVGRYRLVFVAAVLMFTAGFVDDRIGLKPLLKLLVQFAAAGLLVGSGWRLETGLGEVFSVGLTVFWVLGITNAVNLVDNMDGLSSGIAGIAALSLAAMAMIAGAGALAVTAAAVTGAAGGFLLYNFKPARIFMGDCGSLFLGFVLAALAVMIQAELGMRGLNAIGMMVLVLGVPILDTTLVTVVRSLHNRPVSQGGRDHTSHRLVHAGLSEKQAVLLLYGLAAVFAVLAPIFYASDVRLRVSLTVFTFLGAVIFAVQIGTLEVYEKSDGRRSWVAAVLMFPRLLLGPAWKPALAIVADVLIVGAAFVLAHHLRFESALTASQERFLLMSLPVVVGVSIPVFALFGFYRAIWRHAGAYDVAWVVVAVSLAVAGGFVGLGLMHGFGSVSRGVIVISWMAIVLGVIFSRFGFRGLRSWLTAASRAGSPVVVYGAGDEGASTLRILRTEASGSLLRPVAVVDDAPGSRGRSLHGVPVMGGLDALPALIRDAGVTELVLPTNHICPEERDRIIRACRDVGLSCRTVSVDIRRAESSDGSQELRD